MRLHEILNLRRPIFSLDGEMTGVNRTVDRIVQLGIIKLDTDGKLTEWQTLINPEMHIPAEATAVHHITDELVKDAPKFKDIAHALWSKLDGADFVGYNLKFDLGFLTDEFKRCGLVFQPGFIADGFRIFSKMEPRNLTAAVKFFLAEEDLEGAHDALIDCRATLRVLEAQLLRYPDLPRTVEELHRLLFLTVQEGKIDPEGKFAWRDDVPIVNFGKKWNGTPMSDVLKKDRGFYTWMLGAGGFEKETLDIVRDALMGVFPRKDAPPVEKQPF